VSKTSRLSFAWHSIAFLGLPMCVLSTVRVRSAMAVSQTVHFTNDRVQQSFQRWSN